MAMSTPPRAILFDLDDTILRAYGQPEAAWLAVTNELAATLRPLSPASATRAITSYSARFWADPERARRWRMALTAARREVVAGAFAELVRSGAQVPSAAVADQLADRFSAYRVEQMRLYPDALPVIDEFRQRGTRLALVTNGARADQRAKIERFALAHRFDHIQIEEEHGFGKPDPQAYLHALQTLDAEPSETWMVGDNLEWDVEAPQRMGIFAVWFDGTGSGLPPGTEIRPDRTIRSLSELIA